MTKGATNILEALRPLCLYNSLLGLAVFEIPTGRPWPKLSFLYALLKMSLYFTLWWYRRPRFVNSSNSTAIIINVVNVIIIINVVIAVLSIFLGFMNYKKVKLFARRITLADETLEVFGINPEYAATHNKIKYSLAIWYIEIIIIFVSDCSIAHWFFDDILDAILKAILFDVPLMLNTTIDLNFAVLVSILGKRFERLNAVIQNLSSAPLECDKVKNNNKYQNILMKRQNKIAVLPNYYDKNRNNIDFVLKTVRQLHLDLCATSRDVNDTFSKQLSLQMASTFLLLTGFGYCAYIIYNEMYMALGLKLQYFITLGIWIVISIFRIIYVVRITVNVANEAQKTSQLAHEIQVSRFQKKIINEIHQLSLQIMQHPLYFTASGLIVLDFGYVRGFVGSVTTYLMILIQNQPDMIKAAETLAEVSSNTTKSTV